MSRKNQRKKTYVKPIKTYKYVNRYGVGFDNRDGGSVPGEDHATTQSQHLTPQPKRPVPQPRRGDIWFARLGNHYGSSIQSGTRPVLIISNDQANRHSEAYTAIPLTTRIKKLELPTHVQFGARFCERDKDSVSEMMEDSMLLVEQLTTVGRESLLDRLGRVDDEDKLAEIERAIVIQTGIREPNRRGGTRPSERNRK